MATPSPPFSEKDAAPAELEYVDTSHEEANIGTEKPLQNTLTAQTTTNEVNFKFVMLMVGFSLAFVVAEVTPLFLITVFTIIAFDLNASHYIIWILVSQLIAIGAICPFVGTLSDLFGRKKIILFSLILTIVGNIVLGTAQDITAFLAAQVILGLSIGIQLLTVIAAVTELVPTSRRGITIGYVVCGFIPFCPASLYGQYIAAHNWRYIAVILGACGAIAFVILVFYYHPPPRENGVGLTKRQLLGRIDYVGSLLSTAGLAVFLVGLNWGGQDYPWSSPQVISTLTIGLACWVAFFVWEKFFSKFPMFPMRLAQNPKHFIAIAVLCLTSGINYIPVVVFWVIQSYAVYEASFEQAGINLLPIGFCIVAGAIASAVLLTVFPRKIHIILIVFCVAQTAGLGAMAAVDPENINTVWAPLIIGLIGVGGVLLPSQVIFSIITPNDLIGTGVALSVVIRMIGQVVGVSMFYNIFLQRVKAAALEKFAIPAITAGFYDVESITALVTALGAGPLQHYVNIGIFPQLDTPEKVASIILAGHETYKGAFPILYLIAIAFGAIAIGASFFLSDLDRYMNDDIAVLL